MNYLDIALAYAARGWSVFALAPGQKVPRKGTKGVKDATRDEETIRRMWAETPNANIGIACGVASDLLVIDIDPRHDGHNSLKKLQGERDIPATVYVKTGGGGYQFYFKHVPDLQNGAGLLGEGIDHRTDNGYVVAPPSMHPSGNRYEFMEGYENLEPVDAPDWIVDGLRKKQKRQVVVSGEYYRDLFARGAKEGERNDAIVKMAGHLIRRRLDPYLVLDILGLWNDHRLQPPGDKDKLMGIVDRVAGLELERITKKRKPQ